MADRRRPARLLAPLALVAAVVATFLVVSNTLSGSDGSASDGTAATQTATTTTQATSGNGKGKRKRQPRFYTVQPGDILSTVSEQTGVSVEELQALNPEVDPQALQVGQRLRLRAKGGASTP